MWATPTIDREPTNLEPDNRIPDTGFVNIDNFIPERQQGQNWGIGWIAVVKNWNYNIAWLLTRETIDVDQG